MGNTPMSDIPGPRRDRMFVATILSATGSSIEPLWSAPFKCRVLEVAVIPQAAVPGDDTDYKELNIQNRGSSGSATTEITSRDLVGSQSLDDFEREIIGTGLTAAFEEDDVLAVSIVKVADGVLLPNMVFEVVYEPALSV